MAEVKEVPPWLPAFVGGRYLTTQCVYCEWAKMLHSCGAFFCLTCKEDSLCGPTSDSYKPGSPQHAGHATLQVRKDKEGRFVIKSGDLREQHIEVDNVLEYSIQEPTDPFMLVLPLKSKAPEREQKKQLMGRHTKCQGCGVLLSRDKKSPRRADICSLECMLDVRMPSWRSLANPSTKALQKMTATDPRGNQGGSSGARGSSSLQAPIGKRPRIEEEEDEEDNKDKTWDPEMERSSRRKAKRKK